MHPRIQFIFLAADTHCWLLLILPSTKHPDPFHKLCAGRVYFFQNINSDFVQLFLWDRWFDKDTVVHIFHILPTVNAIHYVLRAYSSVRDWIASAIGIIYYRGNNEFYTGGVRQNILIFYQAYLSNLVFHRFICSANLCIAPHFSYCWRSSNSSMFKSIFKLFIVTLIYKYWAGGYVTLLLPI